MNILILGSGGREHALAWAVMQNPKCDRLIVAPGNAGIAQIATCAALDIEDGGAVVAFAEENAIDFVIVGPEAPLAAGVADALRGAGILTFGPSAEAARLEASKGFTKEICDAAGAPTAGYARFDEKAAAVDHVRRTGAPIVVKADGLAAGKGVVVALTLGDAEQALHDMLGAHSLGDASARVVIEEFLEGEEASYIVISDGQNALPMATSQDHKRVGEADTGPNTGGMGAYSPAPVVTPEVDRRIMDEVIRPTLAGMAAEGAPFIGFLYAGLMIDRHGAPKVIEFNVRFGDPETQPIMLRLQSDLVELIESALAGRLKGTQVQWDPRPAIGVVMAAHGYPGKVRGGDPIDGLDSDFGKDTKVFHAGTRERDGKVVTAGGRVLTVCALGKDLGAARECAYSALAKLRFDGAFHRRDIGHRALSRE